MLDFKETVVEVVSMTAMVLLLEVEPVTYILLVINDAGNEGMCLY